MTPNDIEVLIHCYTSGSEHPRISAPAVKESIKEYIEQGMIEKASGFSNNNLVYITTERGAAHIANLCSIPFPEKTWVNSNGEVIK